MRRRLALGAIAVVSTCTLLAGCGSSSSGGSTGSTGSTSGGTNNSSAAPKTELTDALHALSSGSALTTTLSLDTTAENIKALAAAGKHPTPITDAQANLIATARITVETLAPAGKTLAQAATPASASGETLSISGTAGGKSYFSIVDVGKALYAQIDLKGILDAAGQDAAYQAIRRQTSSAPPFVQDFLAGKYVTVPFSALSDLVSVIKAGLQGGSGSNPIPNPTQLLSLRTKLLAAFVNDLTVSRTSTGSTDQLEVSANVQQVAKDFLTALSQAIPAVAGQIDPSQADQVPSKVVKVEADVTGGALSALKFDITQFAPEAKTAKQRQLLAETPTIVMSFARSGSAITAPSGATPISFQDLVTFFTSFAGSTG